MRQAIVTTVMATISLVATGANKDEPKGDFYTNIATMKHERTEHYEKESITPPKLTGPELTFNGGKAFDPMKKISTLEQVKEALKKLRKDHEIYLRDIAPRMQTVRQRKQIRDMQWRYESDQDKVDFTHTLTGKGKWKNIQIPYYHGPQGPSTAWYRTEIEVDEKMLDNDLVVLHFNGADYYCDAYVNGHHVGFHEGMLDPFEFHVKKYLKPGKNSIMMRLRNDYSMLGSEDWTRRWGQKVAASNCPGWDDPMTGWNCCPAGYGLNQDVYLETRSYVYLEDLFPRPILAEDSVELWVELELPDGNRATHMTLETSIYGQNFEATVVQNHRKKVRVTGGRCLYKIKHKIAKDKLRLWSPDTPWLYQVQLNLYDGHGKKLMDSKKRQFGMRSFIISENSKPTGRMYLNGKEIRLRGTNTMGYLQQNVMRHDWNQLIDDLLLNKLTNMNFIRTTQRSVQEEVYKYADRLGVMMQADLPLFAYLNQKQFVESLKQVSGMERLLRSHPSAIMVTYMNESMAGRQPHALQRSEYENFFDAADYLVRHENPDRAIKYVDGDYQGPNKGLLDEHCYNIWYHGHGLNLGYLHRGGWRHNKKDWMYGCGEFGAEGLDTVDMMSRRYPDNWMPKNRDINQPWHPKLMKTAFKTNQTGGKYWDWFEGQTLMKDWVERSREHQAWGVRMVTESFRRMPKMNTFAIHLFIDAWPNGWMKSIVDCERKPKDAWYAYRDALTPISVQLRTDRTAFFAGEKYPFEAWICSDKIDKPICELRYQVEKDGQVIQTGKVPAQMPNVTDGSRFQGWLPVTAPPTTERTTFNVRMGLFDEKGKQLHEVVKTLDLYPKIAKPQKRLYLIGKANAHSKSIARAFDLTPVNSGEIRSTDAIMVTDYKAFDQQRKEVESAVEGGANCILLPMFKENGITFGGSALKWQGSAFTRWIVHRNLQHPWLTGTGHNDFKFNYDTTRKSPIEHYARRFSAKGFKTILHRSQAVAVEKKSGKGTWIIFQTTLEGKASTPAWKTLLNKALF